MRARVRTRACGVQAAWDSPTLSAAKGKRLLGYFYPRLRTQSRFKPAQSLRASKWPI